jgi:ABC-type sulfate/molybdate transport systems ATPase subunit
MSEEPVLSARRLSAERGGKTVLEGVDLELRRGEVVAVLGPNGAGKTTLLRVLAGLLPARSGEVHRSGTVAAALQATALARRSVQANVVAALSWWGVPREERAARARSALERFDIDHAAHRPARDLSGGEARRVHLARALAVEPDALLLDEPFAGLDATTRADLLYDAASALRSDSRATLVIVHDRAEAWALADRLVVLMDGTVQATGDPREVFERPPSARVAEFVGFSGRLSSNGTIRMVRPADVAVEPGGPTPAEVRRAIPVEDGTRLELVTDRGSVVAIVPPPGPRPGERVRLRISGGIEYPAGTDSERNAR